MILQLNNTKMKNYMTQNITKMIIFILFICLLKLVTMELNLFAISNILSNMLFSNYMDVLFSASFFSNIPSEFLEEVKQNLRRNIKILLSEGVDPKHFLSKKDIKLYGEDFLRSVINEYNQEVAARTREQKLQARRERAAAKKASLNKFFNSDLYGIVCAILGFDIKSKLKSLALNSKWITAPSHPTVQPEDFSMNFFTFDIECYQDNNGNFVPYQFGLYHPDHGYKSFYGPNCMNTAFSHILNFKFNSTEVIFYAHNSGKFDGLYVIKELQNHNIENIRVLKDKQNSIFLIEFYHNGYIFRFKDSFKLLPLGLDKLLKDFNIEVNGLKGKLPFEHSWMSASNLFYKGDLPDWLQGHEKELKSMGVIKRNKFSIQRYCEIYNKIDCEGLHKLIYKFFYTLVCEFKIDFSSCVTLPQLSMEVFRSKFLKNNKTIRLLSDRHYRFIKQAYKGANVSVYKPYGEHLYAYDVNSLYPFCMLKDMPVGTPKPYDVSKGLENLFGFAEAEVACPSNLNIPVLPVKAVINGTEKLVFPTGTFKGVFFSEELKYAETLGYSIKLIRGLEFNRSKDLFYSYVHNFYNKKSNGKGAIKTISKLFLNSLYGRFAMSKEFESNFITSNENMKDQLLNVFTNIKPEPLNDKSVLFSFNVAPNSNLENIFIYELLHKLFNMSSENRIGNIAIASAITAYAR